MYVCIYIYSIMAPQLDDSARQAWQTETSWAKQAAGQPTAKRCQSGLSLIRGPAAKTTVMIPLYSPSGSTVAISYDTASARSFLRACSHGHASPAQDLAQPGLGSSGVRQLEDETVHNMDDCGMVTIVASGGSVCRMVTARR